jgi:hypothetical protein
MVFPRVAAVGRFTKRLNPRAREYRYAMSYGAPLMAGWTVLLLWADRRPHERRDVLLITAVPVVAGLMAHDARHLRRGELRLAGVLPLRALQAGLFSLFLRAWWKSRSRSRRPRGLGSQ